MITSYRKGSRTDWGTCTGPTLTLSQINTGALLRIADATETMAQNHVRLQKERDWYQSLYEGSQKKIAALERSNSALRGRITKLKKGASRSP